MQMFAHAGLHSLYSIPAFRKGDLFKPSLYTRTLFAFFNKHPRNFNIPTPARVHIKISFEIARNFPAHASVGLYVEGEDCGRVVTTAFSALYTYTRKLKTTSLMLRSRDRIQSPGKQCSVCVCTETAGVPEGSKYRLPSIIGQSGQVCAPTVKRIAITR